MNRPDAKFIHVGSEIAKTMDPKCTFTETKFNSSIIYNSLLSKCKYKFYLPIAALITTNYMYIAIYFPFA